MLIDFSDTKECTHWMTVNDDVMGGLSQSRFEKSALSSGIFSGQLSLENNGGFASVRKRADTFFLNDCAGVMLKVKGDGRTYQFRVKTDDQIDGVGYRALFVTDAQQWQIVTLSFDSFCAVYRGRKVPDAAVLCPDQIRQIGFLLADKQQGPFHLEISWINSFQATDND